MGGCCQDHPALPAPAAAPAAVTMAGASRGIFLIAVFDLVKAGLFLVAAAGIFHLVNRNTQVELTPAAACVPSQRRPCLRQEPAAQGQRDQQPGQAALQRRAAALAPCCTPSKASGLLLRQRWAEYFAVAMTAIPLPFEVHTLIHHATHSPAVDLVPTDQQVPRLFHDHLFLPKVAVLIINVAIVWFLIYHLRREWAARPRARARRA